MAHLSEGTLRRMFDDPDALGGSDRRHYATCADCHARYAGLADEARAVATMLAVPDLKVDADAAFKRVQAAPDARPRFGFGLPIFRPVSRPMFAGVVATVAIAALVVTAFANILPVFQPKTVEPVPITVGDMETLSQLSDYGTLTWSKQPKPEIVLSAAEAAKVSGLHVPVVGTLPAGVSTTVTYAAMPQSVAVFTFDADKAAAAAAKSGKALPALPANMNGATLTVTVGPAVLEVFGNLQNGASSGSEINLPQLIVAAVPGLSPQLAATIRSIGDSTTTLLVPVPIQYATSSKVKVQGVQGVALGDNTGAGSAVIWIKNGTVYGVVGVLKQSEVLSIANQLS